MSSSFYMKQLRTFVNVDTSVWNQIISHLIKINWEIVYKYDAFDAGIDYDLIILKNKESSKELVLGWSNNEEGEITFEEENQGLIENLIEYKFELGSALNTKKSVVAIFYSC